MKSLLIVAFLLPLLVFDIVHYFALPEKESQETPVILIVPRGASLSQIADSLQKKGLIEQTKLFQFWAKTLGHETSLKAGIYDIPKGLNYPQLISYLANTKPVDIRVMLIEGWSTENIIKELSQKLQLEFHLLDSLVNDPGFCLQVGVKANNLTGYLLPDTYAFPYGISEQQVLHYLVQKTIAIFNSDTVKAVLSSSGYNLHQLTTLASIVEGEAMIDVERPVIASVYWNRLNRGMKLQADPTVQFALKGKPRRLLYKDLKIDSPYNTYRYSGLPPGPINNPGKASILAVLFPERTNYIYFVAKGDGSHVFSRNSSEHARAKAAFNKVRREVARKKRYQKRN